MVKETALEIESQQFALEPGRMYLIGHMANEQAEVDIALHSKSLDNKHCIVEVCVDAVYVIDLHSKSGTYLNGVRLSPMKKVCAYGETTLRLGAAEGLLRVGTNEKSLDSSGFHEEPKNISNSPAQKTMTPHIDANKNFVVPTVTHRSLLTSSDTILNKSLNTSTVANSTTDSFNIPETQHCQSRSSLSNISLAISEKSCFDANADIDDSFIPETQQPVTNNSPNDDATIEANMPRPSTSNQFFRICTQEFNEDLFGEEVDMESRDLLGYLPASLVIPKIQHEPLLLGEPQQIVHSEVNSKTNNQGEEAEIAALNWSAPTSKCDTLNETGKSVDIEARDDACTPDLFDLPELAEADNLLVDQEQALTMQAVTATEPASINPVTTEAKVTPDNADTCDLLPTQVFTVRVHKEVSLPQTEAECTELSLSGKENMLPTTAADMADDLAKTQVFVCNEDGKNAASRSTRSASSTNTDEVEDVNSLPSTQVFSLSCVKSNKGLTTLNSTLIGGDDKQTRSAASFFKDIEKTPQKSMLCVELKSKQEHSSFRKPTNSKSSTSTGANLLPETEVYMDMCTPQWIKDQFEILSQEQNTIATKQRRIDFGADSDEEIDGLNLLGAEKVSNDFDRLLSHVKDAPACSRARNDGKAGNNSSIVNVDVNKNSQKVEKSKKQKNKEITSSSTLQQKEDDNQKDGKGKLSRKTSTITSSDSIKVDKRTSKSNKSQHSRSALKEEEQFEPARRSTRLKSRTEEPKQEESRRATGEKKRHAVETAATQNKIEKEIRRGKRENETARAEKNTSGTKIKEKSAQLKEKTIPQRRRNTKKSESDKSQPTTAETDKGTESEEQESQDSVRTRRQTRARSKTESQESITSTTSVTTSTENERKRKISVPVKEEPKRLRSTSIASTPPSTTRKLQVSMTMVDPELFQKLAQHAAGIWTIAKDPSDSDVLIMDKGNRTLKFLIAMAKGIPIVTSKWLECINQTKRVPKGSEYLFVDVDFENRHKFSLLKSQELARKQKLFEGYEFLMTPSIMPQPSDMKEIIKCAGGILHTDIPAPKKDQKLYLISTPKDTKLWHKYRRTNNNIRITSSEGVMASIMRQKVKPLDMHLLS